MAASDWSYTRRPFWVLSHLFAATVIGSFAFFGVWQLDRHGERRDVNAVVQDRSARPAVDVATALASGSPAEIDYLAVVDRGEYLAAEQVMVRNRSQAGVAGSWVVTPLRTESGPVILVTRGFVADVTAAADSVAVPVGTVEISGWLRVTQERGSFGPRDPDEGRLGSLARVDVSRIDAQVPGEVAPMWLQLAQQQPAPVDGIPAPVPLPEPDDGNHLSYAVQWFIFAGLGVIVYGLLLRRRAAEAARPDAAAPALEVP
jgi:surfeit locus 1 family protein